ncbi:hypothetical protein [Nonomuraea jiangxiensis]|uniref:YtkA-like n=1 Tax=Nonomuraea jiangxiensis TaxID=633440 RepID=A0A1G9DCP0_9ACTN|nr:hypothetical protein [Nonomuraea jiangxiensis]SDK61610.1 hypothetical protein SAMN05421869_11784 [Nonomuraea jiangxiensis]
MRRRVLIAVALVVVAVTLFVVGRGAAAGPLELTTTGTRYAATVLIDRPTTGRVVVEVRLRSGDPSSVALEPVMPDMGHAMPEVAAREREPGRFLAEGELFPMAGVWELSIRLDGPAGEETLAVNALITE